MTVKYAKAYSPTRTPQSEPLDNTQVQNSAGGYVYQLDDWKKLDRFVVLGTEGGTYYAREQTLTRDNAKTITALIKQDGERVVNRIVELSTAGRAYKNDAALFVLSLAITVGDNATKRDVKYALLKVARTGTHLFTFAGYAYSLRGKGRALNSALRHWYESKAPDKLAYQITKYAQRDGWSHRDLLRLLKPRASGDKAAVYSYAVGKKVGITAIPYLAAVEEAASASSRRLAELIRQYDLPREVLPTEMLTNKDIWAALFEKMPMTAMIRNTATMTRVGLIAPLSAAAQTFAERVTDRELLKTARIHPVQMLAAHVTYANGRGARGSHTWKPVQSVVDALDKGFYLSFDAVEPTHKRLLLAVDVSGSMSSGTICGVPNLTPRHGAAAMALTIANTEENYAIFGFSTTFVPLSISPRQRLADVVNYMSCLPFSGTDCALPMVYALENKLDVDAFVVITDNETWAGRIHPVEALREYRKRVNPAAKLVVVGMTSTGFSIADPTDYGMLDVVGMSTDTPQVIADFIRE